MLRMATRPECAEHVFTEHSVQPGYWAKSSTKFAEPTTAGALSGGWWQRFVMLISQT